MSNPSKKPPVVSNVKMTLRAKIERNRDKVEKLGESLNSLNLGKPSKHVTMTSSLTQLSQQSYKDVPVLPKLKEILCPVQRDLKPNIRQGPFLSVEEYLNIHFLLYREDFLRPLQQGMQMLRRNKKEGRMNTFVRVYKNVECFKKKKAYLVQFQQKDYKEIDWDSKLLPGTIILLMTPNFKSIYLALVNDWQKSWELEQGRMRIRWLQYPPPERMDFTLVESLGFFPAYRYTLEIMQQLKPESFPFRKFIVNCSTIVSPPDYVRRFQNYVKIGDRFVSLLKDATWPTAAELKLNQNQLQALKNSLTKEFSIVQGPPGTGKTFLALKLVEVFLNNPHLWNPAGQFSAPILIVCYTNHALDQFLEGILGIFEKKGEVANLIRVGRGGDSEILEPFNIGCIRSQDRIGRVKRARILGMTTTGAAKYYEQLLIHAKPRIVIVEEAAEVVESHIIPCLLPNCQHLILLGDHQQLQPNINVHELSVKYFLDLSLFERMVNNKLHLCTLNVQHRMRPEISELIKGTIYKGLQDASKVMSYPDILGVDSNVFFITHDQPESAIVESPSKANAYEADYLLGLCRYLLQQGYSPGKITILATYKGQVELLTNKIEVMKDDQLLEVDVSTVDGYQGKENDIILLSLVRSNEEGKIGFLKKDNRICVALSRAKHGLYAIGDVSKFTKKSTTWKNINEKLEERSSIGPYLKVKCQTHGNVNVIKTTEDFKVLVPHGGCKNPCNVTLECGHICKKRCHLLKDHEESNWCKILCHKKCSKGHSYHLECYKSCPVCFLLELSELEEASMESMSASKVAPCKFL